MLLFSNLKGHGTDNAHQISIAYMWSINLTAKYYSLETAVKLLSTF